ncbi:hypothetical protein OJAV_G00189320 [Oryzias javanicus]|uniref:Uncharacterized protein n=1 Tax=Oryzias javanicus TaxID=123683 RepID=A0A3S2MHK2_ORYJA|nr:hypothetical protein OJAV_G00189320 [Oryzias javanicus]
MQVSVNKMVSSLKVGEDLDSVKSPARPIVTLSLKQVDVHPPVLILTPPKTAPFLFRRAVSVIVAMSSVLENVFLMLSVAAALRVSIINQERPLYWMKTVGGAVPAPLAQ